VLVLMVVLRIVQRLRGKGDGPAVGLTPKEPAPVSKTSTPQTTTADQVIDPAGSENGHSAIKQVVVAPTGSPATRPVPADRARTDHP